MSEKSQLALEKVLLTVMGETVHTAFRKGCSGPESVVIWNAISKMPQKEWESAVEWMAWAIAYSLDRQIQVRP